MFKRSRFSPPQIVVFICACLHAAIVSANPVPADERSLQNGADAYDLHCAICHGSDLVDESEHWYDSSEYDIAPDFTELVVQVEAEKAAEAERIAALDWPEWAEIPDPGVKADDAQMRAVLMEELSRVIDQAYGTSVDSADAIPLETESLDYGEEFNSRYYADAGDTVSDRLEGATDLTDPDAFVYGTTEEDLFASIAEGTGPGMPGWHAELGYDEAIWDLVNFIRSLWDEEWQDY